MLAKGNEDSLPKNKKLGVRPEASFSMELSVRTAPLTAAVHKEVGCLPRLALSIVFILK